MGIGGIMTQHAAPQGFRHVGHAHGRAGVAGLGLVYGVHGKDTNGIGKFFTGTHDYSPSAYKVSERASSALLSNARRRAS